MSRCLLALTIAIGLTWFPIAQAAPPPDLPGGAGLNANQQAAGKMDVLQRGPVHEAFAEPFAMGARNQAAQVVNHVPPEPVDELPPEIRPEGKNVKWIPGYWMWSDEVNDFVWVSGVWRQVPPGREWTPGHWAKVAGGFQWISGFWTNAGARQVRYLPRPPATLEAGPNVAAPGPNYFWIPGSWNWRQNRYAWRPGYWYQGQTNWLWIPDHYVYTPRGSIFVAGYWDYPLVNRGLLFAPVYWPGYLGNSILRYRPSYVLNSSLLLTGLTINNGHRHYYFGYYNNFGRYGLSPWYNGACYDPFYAYHHWHDGRHNSNWQDHYRHHGGHSHDHGNNASGNMASNGGNSHQAAKPTLGGNATHTLNNLIVPLGQISQTNVTDVPLRRATDSQQNAARQQIADWRQLASQRKRLEQDNPHSSAVPMQKGHSGSPDVVRLGSKPGELATILGGNRTLNNPTHKLGQTPLGTNQGRPDVQPGNTQPQSSNRHNAAAQSEALRRRLQQQQQAVRDQRNTANYRVAQQQQAVQQNLQQQLSQQQSQRYQPLLNRQHALGQPTPSSQNNGASAQKPLNYQNFYRRTQTTPMNSRAMPNFVPSPQRKFQPQRNFSLQRTFQPQMGPRMQNNVGGGSSNGVRTLNNRQHRIGQ